MTDFWATMFFGFLFMAVGFWAGEDFGSFRWEKRIEQGWYICTDDITQICTITETRRPINP